MVYQQFLQSIKHAVEQKVTHEYSVILNQVIKNNDLQLDGITIRKKDGCMVPNIYLNSYFDEFMKGRELESIVQEIMSVYKQAKINTLELSEDVLNYDSVSDKITYRLINLKMNQERLEGMPYKEICDLAKVYYISIKTDKEGTASIAITNETMEKWGITLQKLDGLAENNTPALLPYSIRTMKEILLEMFLGKAEKVGQLISAEDKEIFSQFFQNEKNSDQEHDDMEMYILSNVYNTNGSSCLLYPNVLHDFASQHHSHIYILPSSIHEVILIPAHKKLSKESLKNMVMEVNQSQVAADEVLSNEIYFYDINLDQLEIASEC